MAEGCSATTLPELLRAAADRGLGGWHFHSGRDVTSLSVKELLSRATELSSDLLRAGIAGGARVGILGLNGPEWALWAWGTWLAGAAVVPLPAPLIVGDSFAAQVTSLVNAADCSVVVGARSYLDPLGGEPFALWDWATAVPSIKAPSPTGCPAPSPSDLAAVLSTSGSTSAPKAVRMSHAGALEWAIHHVARSEGDSIASKVTWLPYYHIAGLGTLFELVAPVDQHVVALKRFLADPSSWLRLVGETRASYAVSPSSVWSMVLDGLSRNADGVDLSGLARVVFALEMVDPDVLARMGETLRPLGLRPGAIAVHYASAEAGMISRTPAGRDADVEAVDLANLVGSGRAVPAVPGAASKQVVSCGRPYAGVEICIGHPDRRLSEREEGEVWVRGPGVTDGYLNDAGHGALVDGWLRVGDLGYLADGEVWVTGRADEVVVLYGEKYHPEDIEWAASRATGLRPGACAAFSVRDGRPGEFVLVLEPDEPLGGLVDRASAAVAGAIGVAPATVLVVAPGTIPTTANGKLQRSRLRELYARGALSGREPEAR
jgi:fatty-acyl-CoA synthase